MKSIRRYLVVILLAAITLINFIAAVQGYRAGSRQAERSFDRQLVNVAMIIAGAEVFKPEHMHTDSPDPLVYQIWSSSRVLRDRSPGTPDRAIAGFETGFDHSNFNSHRWRTYSHFDRQYDRWVLVANRMDIRYAMADSIIVDSIMPIVIGIPLAGLIIWFIVGSGLAPLHRLARQLEQKDVDDLSPVELINPPVELHQVLHSTNQLLRRLSDALLREKRFASDAAHELRTPISILKIHLHNLQHDFPEIKQQTPEFRTSLDRLEHLVDQILSLYRCAPDQYIAKFETMDLYRAAQDVIAHQYWFVEHRNQSIELVGSSTEIRANDFAVDTLIENLLSNASKYSPDGSDIRVTVGRDEENPYIRIEDSGPGIPADERERIFERFYRIAGDEEAGTITGSGLGLAIVKNIAQQHKARIILGESAFSSGLSITVLFQNSSQQ